MNKLRYACRSGVSMGFALAMLGCVAPDGAARDRVFVLDDDARTFARLGTLPDSIQQRIRPGIDSLVARGAAADGTVCTSHFQPGTTTWSVTCIAADTGCEATISHDDQGHSTQVNCPRSTGD